MEKIRLLIDCTSIKRVVEVPASTEIYIGRLLFGLSNSKEFDIIVLVYNGLEDYVDSLANYCTEKIVINESDKVTPSIKLDRLLRTVPFERQLIEHKIQVVLNPRFLHQTYLYPKQYNQHVIIHDMIPYFYRNQKMSWLKRKIQSISARHIIRRIPQIITISEGTRQELKKFSDRESYVLHNSIPFEFCVNEQPVKSVEGRPYILDVNRFEKYKNAELLVRALTLIREKIPHLLYLKGDDSRPDDLAHLKQIVKSLNMEDRVIFDVSRRSEGELRYLYTHADLFVTPSLLEGFGYTPLEAAVLETPVLISDIDVLREVSCNRLATFNPYSEKELAEKIKNVIETPPSKEELKKISSFFKQEYSLDKQIKGLIEIIKMNLNYN